MLTKMCTLYTGGSLPQLQILNRKRTPGTHKARRAKLHFMVLIYFLCIFYDNRVLSAGGGAEIVRYFIIHKFETH